MNLFVDNKCWEVDRITNFAPSEVREIPTCHMNLTRGFTNKVELLKNAAVIY